MKAKRNKARPAALYLRVSTAEQNTRNQRRELKAVAERHGWNIVAVFEDAGISGAKGRDKRHREEKKKPQGKKKIKDGKGGGK